MPATSTVESFIRLLEDGHTVEAMERYYADHATMQENAAAPRVGKAALIRHERDALASIASLRAACVRPVFVEGDFVVIRFVVFHTTGPAWQAGRSMFERPGVMEHVAHYRQLLEAGKLALGGPHLDSTGGGMMIAQPGVTEDELRTFAAEDPAVQSGVLRFDVRPWLIGLSA